MIQKAARDFARNECLPGVIERDEQQKFPKQQIMKLADLGFMGMMIKPAYGGAGMDTVSYVLAMEEISKIDASASVCMSVNNSLVCWGLEEYCTEEQKQLIIEEMGVLKAKDIDADEKRKQIIKKEDMKILLGRSPDYLDMLLMGMIFYKGTQKSNLKSQLGNFR